MLNEDLCREDASRTPFGRRPSHARLVVIDDVAVHRMIISRLGHKVGFAPVEAGDVAGAARAIADGSAPACITLDLSLGEQAGLRVLEYLAQLGCMSPVIIISGADATGAGVALAEGRRLGLHMLAAIAKPVDLVLLKDTLAAAYRDWAAAHGLSGDGAQLAP